MSTYENDSYPDWDQTARDSIIHQKVLTVYACLVLFLFDFSHTWWSSGNQNCLQLDAKKRGQGETSIVVPITPTMYFIVFSRVLMSQWTERDNAGVPLAD